VAQGRAVVLLNRGLNIYDVQSGGPGWPVGAFGTGQIVVPGALVLGPGRIFAATPGALIAFDLADGSMAWSSPLSAALTTSLISATSADGSQRLYRTTDTVVSTFGADGTPGWSSPDLNQIGPLQMPAVDATHVYVSGDTQVAALATSDGTMQWTMPLTATQLSPPVLGREVVLVAGHAADNTNSLYALEKSSGAVRRTIPILAGELNTPAIKDTLIYVTSDREVAAYSLATGALSWKQDRLDVGGRGDYLLAEPPVVGPRYLYVASNIGRVWALDAMTGAMLGSINMRDQDRNLELTHNPILSKGRLYVVSNNTPTLYEIGP
jgi:outer membrane protein assembly factor BamB